MPVDSNLLLALVGTSFALALVPGPDMLFVLANGLRHGSRVGVISAIGLGGGLIVHTFLAAIGVSAVIRASPALFDAVRYLGAAYLVWMAISTLRGGAIEEPGSLQAELEIPELREPISNGPNTLTVLRQASLSALLNPKLIVFFIAFLPQFVDQGRGSVWLQLVIMGAVFSLLSLSVMCTVGGLSGSVRKLLLRWPSTRKWIDRIAATVFVGLAARLVLQQH